MTAIRDTLPQNPDQVTADTVVDFIMGLFHHMGDQEYLGEAISQNDHGIQCAVLADQLEGRDSLTAAALLHDIGHFLHAFPQDCAEDGIDSVHEDLGSAFLARFFPASVSEPVRLHVNAKRYLCGAEPAYFDTLSEASVRSLMLQGGPFEGDDLDAFIQQPHAKDAVILRRCDDGAKIEGLDVPTIESYRAMLDGLVVRS